MESAWSYPTETGSVTTISNAVQPVNRQRHFIVTGVIRSNDGLVTACETEAVLTREVSESDWRELKESSRRVTGWR
jgi:tryptophan-rich hypothetical protein